MSHTGLDGEKRYKTALHIHTKMSDGRKTPQEAAEYYAAAGFDAVAFTDHWKYHPSGTMAGLTVISGIEYDWGGRDAQAGVMHIVSLGTEREPLCDRNMSRGEIVDAINAAGGIAVLAHPYWSLNTPEDLLSLKGIGAFEIYNSVSEAHESTRADASYFADLVANRGVRLPMIAADDAHFYDGTDAARAFVMIESDNGDAASLVEAVRRGDFYASQGPELSVRREGRTLFVKTSPCERITLVSNLVIKHPRTVRKEGMTEAVFEIADNEKWARIEAFSGGKYAWSKIYSF